VGCATWLPALTNAQTNGTGFFITAPDTYPWLVFDEQDGTVPVNVNLQGDFNVSSSVHYRVTTNSSGWPSESSAIPGQDFVPTEGTLYFEPGETNKAFTITLLEDDLFECDESFSIVLDQATGGVPISTPEVKVTIRDNDLNPMRVDPDFKPDGLVFCAVQPDGKLLMKTPGQTNTWLQRLLPGGQADPSWAAPQFSGHIGPVLVQASGQVLVSAFGASGPEFTVNGTPCRLLARLNPDGSLDTGFSAELPPTEFWPELAEQSGGQVLVLVYNGATNMLYRLNSNGSMDTTFHASAHEWGTILVAPDGRIVLGEGWYSDPVRLMPDGSPDVGFQPVGTLAAMLSDGNLLVKMETNDATFMTRLTPAGQPDPTFVPLPYDRCCPPNILPAAEGKFWVITYPGGSLYTVRRRNADGSDDLSWPMATIRGMVDLTHSNPVLVNLPDGNLLVPWIPYGAINGQPRVSCARLLTGAPLPRFEVDWASATVDERAGKVPIQILRCGTNREPITVTWRTEGGTARPGVDYVPASGSLHFAARQSRATIELQLLMQNPVMDPDRTVRLRLQGPPPQSQEFPVLEITILDSELSFPPGGICLLPDGRVQLCVVGGPRIQSELGFTYGVFTTLPTVRIEYSENLKDWRPLDSVPWTYPYYFFDEAPPTNVPRFYRAVAR
jgi:uncharacterized delta-60 repeat protein